MSGRGARPWLLLLAVFSSCGDGVSYVRVVVNAQPPVSLTRLAMKASNAGATSSVVIAPPQAASFTTPTSFALRFDRGRRGEVMIEVRALVGELEVGAASGRVEIVPGGIATLELLLSPADRDMAGGDLAADGGEPAPDLAMDLRSPDQPDQPDLAVAPSDGSESADLAPVDRGVDVAMSDQGGLDRGADAPAPDLLAGPADALLPDLAAPDLLLPDLAAPDLLLPDLAAPDLALPASCSNNMKDGSETDLDCGGLCARCALALRCAVAADCASGVCFGGRCARALGFSAPALYTVRPSPSALVAADLNGDGKLDLVVADQATGEISVLFNKGDGTFLAAVHYPVGMAPLALVAGSFNPGVDTLLDIAVCNSASGTVSVLLNKGAGILQAAVPYTVKAFPTSIGFGDVSADGIADLVVANGGGNAISILVGAADGKFTVTNGPAVAGGPRGLALADLDLDKTLDLVVATQNLQTISVFSGLLPGGFAAAKIYPAGMGPQASGVGDWNGDGRLDLAVVNFSDNAVSVLLNDVMKGFVAAAPPSVMVGAFPSSVAVADLNGDGRADVAVSNSQAMNGNSVSVLQSLGSGAFAAALNVPTGAATGPASVVIADLDGKGLLDLATANSNSNTVGVVLAK